MAKLLNKDGSSRKPRKINCITWIKPSHVSLVEIAKSENEIKYSELLKKLWAYWKNNKLYRIEKLKKE